MGSLCGLSDDGWRVNGEEFGLWPVIPTRKEEKTTGTRLLLSSDSSLLCREFVIFLPSSFGHRFVKMIRRRRSWMLNTTREKESFFFFPFLSSVGSFRDAPSAWENK